MKNNSKFINTFDGYQRSSPHSRAFINETCRILYYTHPIINSIINSHSELPINYLKIELPLDPDISKFYNNMINDIHLKNVICEMIKEYWLVGEAFIYAELNESTGSWARLFLQDPDYIIVKRSVIQNDCSYFLRPDENLRRMVFSTKPIEQEEVKELSDIIIHCIKHGENIPLDNFYLSHLVRRISPYEVRGSGLLNPILKLVIDNNNTDPETIRTCLMDPFSISGGAKLEILKFRYSQLFSTIEQWAATKIFKPIAKINSFYEIKNGDKHLVIPSIKFDIDSLIKALKE